MLCGHYGNHCCVGYLTAQQSTGRYEAPVDAYCSYYDHTKAPQLYRSLDISYSVNIISHLRLDTPSCLLSWGFFFYIRKLQSFSHITSQYVYNSAPPPTPPTIPDLIVLTIHLLKSVNHEPAHYVIISIFPSLPPICLQIHGIHKRIVSFQKLTRNLFLTLHGHNVHRQQQQLSKFLMRCQQFVSHAYCGASFQDGVAAGKGFLCAPFWGVQVCDYSAAWVSCMV